MMKRYISHTEFNPNSYGSYLGTNNSLIKSSSSSYLYSGHTYKMVHSTIQNKIGYIKIERKKQNSEKLLHGQNSISIIRKITIC